MECLLSDGCQRALRCRVVPVSGGGMLSGIAIAAKALKPSIKIIAAEPCGSNDAADVAACKAEGQLIQDMPKPLTIADGLQGKLCTGKKLPTSFEH